MQNTVIGRILGKFSTQKPVMNEVAAARTGLLSSAFRMAAYSPDDLVSRKGLAVYDEMQKDAQVRSCLNTKKFAILSKGWQLLPASDSAVDVEIADFVRFCFDDMRGSVQDMIFAALDAIAKGFSVMEINYKPLIYGPFAGKIGLDSIKSKDPAAFGFDMDDYLNILGITMAESGAQVDLPMEKFIVYTYMPSYEMPYGQSDLRPAYKHWFCKEIISKFWSLHLEKFGMPTAKGSYKRGMPKDQQDELLRALDKIQQETAIVIPEDVTIELLEAKRDGEAGYLRAIEFHNRQIAKAILGQTLTSDEGSRSGSFAMAKVHLDILGHYLQKLKRDIEETVMRDQLIRRMVEINYGVRDYPRFVLGTLDERDPALMGSFVEKLVSSGVVAPDEGWIRDYLGIPGG